MLIPIARALRGISLGVWLGGSVMTFIAAHYVFGIETNRNMAGDIMGSILHTAGWLKIGLATVALGSQLCLHKDPSQPKLPQKFCWVTLVIASLMALFVALYLEPKMVDLRAQYMNDSNPENPARVLFKQLHGGSMGIALLETILIAVALVCAVL